jgi:hypothetical protein
VPHDFGTGAIQVIDGEGVVTARTKSVEALLDIEIATSLLKEGVEEGENPIDANFRYLRLQLRCARFHPSHPPLPSVEV